MKVDRSISALSDEMYSSYGFADDVGIRFFQKFCGQLRNLEFTDFVDYQLRNYPHDYVLSFFLSTPFLWPSLPLETWCAILERPDARPDTSHTIEIRVSHFTDIEFLCRFAKIDALSYVVESRALRSRDKKNTLDYFLKFPYGLLSSDLDKEDLDGIYHVSEDSLQELGDDLRKTLCFKPFAFDESDLRGVIRELYRSIN